MSHLLTALTLLLAGPDRLTDKELDEIIGRYEWPSREVTDKLRGATTRRGTVPRGAARDTFAAVMKKNGIPAADRTGFDWHSAELEAGFIYDAAETATKGRRASLKAVEWSALVPVGKAPDTLDARRGSLRLVQGAALELWNALAYDVAGPKGDCKGLAEAVDAIAKVNQAREKLDRLRGESRDALGKSLETQDESKVAEALAAMRERLDAARRDLAARREELAKLVTRREEARLLLRGVME